jgi:hypothetical protein
VKPDEHEKDWAVKGRGSTVTLKLLGYVLNKAFKKVCLGNFK